LRSEDTNHRPAGSNDERGAPRSRSEARSTLTRREREILGLLAEGMSGAQIAEKLVLSPETVRTHVRNARSKLGATTRSQAVALALRQNAIAGAEPLETPDGTTQPQEAPAIHAQRALGRLLGRLLDLHDVDHAAAYVAEEDGLSLRLVAEAGADDHRLPEKFALGEGALGRAALERRVQVGAGSGAGALIAAPIVGKGRLLGALAFEARISRPVGRSEMLLLRAFATRVGEVLAAGDEVERRLDRAADRFRASWLASTRTV
jgi:DNA-binding CsgD family transcriptional regulator